MDHTIVHCVTRLQRRDALRRAALIWINPSAALLLRLRRLELICINRQRHAFRYVEFQIPVPAATAVFRSIE